jgi:undecaprenyl-diphosphatase
MNIDDMTVKWLNDFSHRELFINLAVVYLTSTNLFKGGFSVALLWTSWITTGKVRRECATIWRLLLGILLALCISRVIQEMFPMRNRPILEPGLALAAPNYFDPSAFAGWSSFPSDNAALFSALATVTFITHRKLGVISYLHAVFIVSLPRVYLGLHYPSDVLVGLMLGIAVVILMYKIPIPSDTTEAANQFLAKYIVLHLFFLSLFTFMCATMFYDIRIVFKGLWDRI